MSELKKVIGEPQFREGAKLEVSLERIDKINKIGKTATDNPVNPVQENSATPRLRERIPLADGNPDSRNRDNLRRRTRQGLCCRS